jgi:hypothetical protein
VIEFFFHAVNAFFETINLWQADKSHKNQESEINLSVRSPVQNAVFLIQSSLETFLETAIFKSQIYSLNVLKHE